MSNAVEVQGGTNNAENIADVQVPTKTDFIDQNKVVLSQTSGEATASHEFRISKDFIIINDAQDPGTVLFNMSLDPTVDSGALKLAQNYEYFSFRDIEVSMDETSPFGTASGGFQAAWITDPANAVFGQASAAEKTTSLIKIVRQEGSVLVRPRSSAIVKIVTSDRRYTLLGTDVRLSSFGNIVCALRAAPGLGDVAAFAVTVSGIIDFHRMNNNHGATLASTKAQIDQIIEGQHVRKAGQNFIEMDIITSEQSPGFHIGKMLFEPAIRMLVKTRHDGFVRVNILEWETADATSLGMNDNGCNYKIRLPLTECGNVDHVLRTEVLTTPLKFRSSYLGK
jgi:hypothetical protein